MCECACVSVREREKERDIDESEVGVIMYRTAETPPGRGARGVGRGNGVGRRRSLPFPNSVCAVDSNGSLSMASCSVRTDLSICPFAASIAPTLAFEGANDGRSLIATEYANDAAAGRPWCMGVRIVAATERSNDGVHTARETFETYVHKKHTRHFETRH